MSATDDAGWVRVGDMLQVRRVELSPRYKNLAMFCREREIDYRLAWDIENHARTNFRRGTRTSIEVAYGWEPGSIEHVLGGGEPVLKAEGASVSEVAPLVALDEFEARVLSSALPRSEQVQAIHRHRDLARQMLDELGLSEPPSRLRRAVRHLADETGIASDEDQRRGA